MQLARQQADRSESEREEGKKELLGEISFFAFSQCNVSLSQPSWQIPWSRSTSAPPASTSLSPRSPSTVATPIAGSAWPVGGGNLQIMECVNRELNCFKRKRALASQEQ